MKWRPFLLVAVVGLLVLAILPAQAVPDVPATRVSGNSNCTSVGSSAEFSLKLEPVTAGPHTGPGGAVITISNLTPTGMPTMFDFSISGGAARDVIVKGSAANWYNYDGGEGSPSTGDDGLRIPNGNSLKSATFCYDLTNQIAGTKFNDANASGTNDGDAGVSGWQIFLLIDTGESFTFVDSEVTDTNGRYSFLDPAPNANYVVCEADQGSTGGPWFQTGPLEEENRVCPGSAFIPGGDPEFPDEVALAPGGYAVSYASGDSVTGRDFFNFDGEEGASGQPLPCGDTASASEGGTSGSFTREFSGGCDDVKNALVGVEGEEVFFIPRGLGTSNYTGELFFVKQFSDPELLVLQYDPDDTGPQGFRDVPACEDVTFSEGGTTATIPNFPVETWCFYDVDAQPASEAGPGDWDVHWSVFGMSDPRFK